MSKLSYTGYSERKKKDITVISPGVEHLLKAQLYYFFKPDAVLTICEFGNSNTRLDELMLKDIFEIKNLQNEKVQIEKRST
jgi:hypothetical protein